MNIVREWYEWLKEKINPEKKWKTELNEINENETNDWKSVTKQHMKREKTKHKKWKSNKERDKNK